MPAVYSHLSLLFRRACKSETYSWSYKGKKLMIFAVKGKRGVEEVDRSRVNWDVWSNCCTALCCVIWVWMCHKLLTEAFKKRTGALCKLFGEGGVEILWDQLPTVAVKVGSERRQWMAVEMQEWTMVYVG